MSNMRGWVARNAKVLLAAAWLLAGVPYLMYELVCALSGPGGNVFGDVRAILLTLAAWIGAPFLVWRTLLADRQTYINRERHYTDLFTKAVELLGATRSEETSTPVQNVEAGVSPGLATRPPGFTLPVPNIESRLGAIFALERLCKDSRSDYGAIIETLSAYIREQCGKPSRLVFGENDPGEDGISIQERAARLEGWRDGLDQWSHQLRTNPSSSRADVAAAFRVLVRRKEGRRWSGTVEHEVEPDLDGANLQGFRIGAELMEFLQRDKINLANCHLEGAILDGQKIEGSPILGPHIERQPTEGYLVPRSFVGASLVGLTLKNAEFFPILEAADISYARMQNAKCEGGRFGGALMIRANFDNAQALNAKFSVVRANNAYFAGADLGNAEFIGAILQGVNFIGTDLRNAVFYNANLQNAHLRGALLIGTDFTEAKGLEPEMFEQAFGSEDTTLPSYMPRPRHWADDASAIEEWNKFRESNT